VSSKRMDFISELKQRSETPRAQKAGQHSTFRSAAGGSTVAAAGGSGTSGAAGAAGAPPPSTTATTTAATATATLRRSQLSARLRQWHHQQAATLREHTTGTRHRTLPCVHLPSPCAQNRLL
jgi:hypothetical protein